jgi:hypothetical protein
MEMAVPQVVSQRGPQQLVRRVEMEILRMTRLLEQEKSVMMEMRGIMTVVLQPV